MAALQKAHKLPDNIFALHALYDAGTCNKNNLNDPCTPAQYQTNGATAGNPSFPTMEVIPDAGTTRLYEKKIVVKKQAVTPAKARTPTDTASATTCTSILGSPSQPFNPYIANNFVCDPSSVTNG